MNAALVVGASGGIASAVLSQLLSKPELSAVVAVSRGKRQIADAARLQWIESDYSPESVRTIVARLGQRGLVLKQVYICTGVLHGDGFKPEKRLEALHSEAFHRVMEVNALVPMRWLQALIPLIDKSSFCTVGVLSARVGSIGDNKLGGWYSYRSSKAALNMLLKTAAIELSRRFPKLKLLAFHPGTTDTLLSRPFQSTVPKDKLFSPEFAASRFIHLLEVAEADGQLDYLDWDGKHIAW